MENFALARDMFHFGLTAARLPNGTAPNAIATDTDMEIETAEESLYP
jgi:hypothetical protein